MQDTKTGGSRWIPDIRPEEIDTYQETNNEESATYKIVNAHPILSHVLDKLAFFRTHAAAVWYNKLANKTVKDKLDEIDASIGSIDTNINEIESSIGNINTNNAVLLWINSAPSASFEAQTISLNLSGYEGVEVEFAENGTIKCYAKSPLGYRGQVQYVSMTGIQTPYSVNLDARTFGPTVTGVQFFAGCVSSNLSGSSSVVTDNAKMIPLKIWGLKSISN